MMTGPTLTLAVSPTVESTPSFPSPSSHSPEELPSAHAGSASHSRSWSEPLPEVLPKLPVYVVPATNFDADADGDADADTVADFSPNLTFVHDQPREIIDEKVAGHSIRNSLGGLRSWTESMGKRRSSTLSRPQSWLPTSQSTPDLTYIPQEATATEALSNGEDSNTPAAPILTPQAAPKSVSDSFASFARLSWISTSRSPSPNPRQQQTAQMPQKRTGRERAPSSSSILKLRRGSRTRSTSSSSEGSQSNESLGRIGNYWSKIKSRPQAARVRGRVTNELDSSASSTISLAPPSTETRKSHASETSNSTFPDDVATAIGRRSAPQDPLWSNFKSLETDFQKFQSRTTALKMELVRNSLVPFLRKFASHPSNLNLRNEDLERRAVILNKWWTGLLEMLHVRTHPPVPGVDRPMLLDVVSGIMMRPEWRQSTPSFRPLADRPRQQSPSDLSESTSSFHSTDSDYLAESTEHNVRNMFTANLIAQMAIVVEKMSLRSAPNSLVNFAGKACAYAFFFAPGVADVLVRLWCLNPTSIRRVASEFNLSRQSKGEGDDMLALFPPSLDKLGWTSLSSVLGGLRQPAPAPLTSARINWSGPWLARWSGRDSDLLFIFCKYYFVLTQGFLPSDLPLEEKARAPGFVHVNAQMLSVLDSTIHRQSMDAISAPLFSDGLHGANASAMALQLAPSNNAMKGMAENRLIALLKNFLSDPSAFGGAPDTFAQSFLAVMKAAIKHTSQFDHNACFTVCDFLEQSLVIYNDYTDRDSSEAQKLHLDWPFWFEVFKRILECNNSMSEIRVLSLVFSIWDVIASNQSRKESVCFEWLLTEDTFSKFFNNWCPMVRAYYMRLLCWRICRDAGSANESDTKIFQLVFTRLKTVWSHYLWLKQRTEQQGKFAPSTAPSFPTPGKRFMIIRTEIPVLQPSFVPGFDAPSSPRLDMTGAATDFDSIKPVINSEVAGTTTTKKTWSLFGKVLSFTASTDAPDEPETARRGAAPPATNAAPPKLVTNVASPAGSDTDSSGSSPTYEAASYLFKFTLSWNSAGTAPPPNRILTRPRLPSPAQSCISVKPHGGSLSLSAITNRPAPTRAVSGSALPGLVDSAKNQSSLDDSDLPVSRATEPVRRGSFPHSAFSDLHEDDVPLRNTAGLSKENLVSPAEPTGSFARTVKYSGKALAEWSLVVSECNGFVERRREEGVFELEDVEVPTLGVEGFRKICQ
ncbi:DUF1765-domain-containing protein [Xylaria sp. CBS 124048]|nr:DUF1765-domain-containing protein [Xylaria sp. CBS 124048]